MVRYFAYGSCTNAESFRQTMNGYDYSVLGIGRLDGYRLAFTRETVMGTGALDVIESKGDYVLGVVYEIPEDAVDRLNKREGRPKYYDKKELNVKLNGKYVDVLTYVVVEKHLEEICPSKYYYNTVLEGMKENSFEDEYISRYFTGRCREKFSYNLIF
jgi:cation transport regulator ChaC